jgi:hypothetical protein
LAIKENSNYYKLGEVGQSLVWVSLSHLTSPCDASLCAEAGKYHLFGLARVCIASEDKKRQLCKLDKVVLTCGLDGIRTRGA